MVALNMFNALSKLLYQIKVNNYVYPLINNDPLYLQKKFMLHRTFTCVIFILFCCSGIFSWLIDNAVDPIAAKDTIWPRIASLWLLVPAFVMRRTKNYKQASILVITSAIADLLHSLAVFKILNNSLPLGVGGFLYYPLGTTLLCLGLSIRVSLICLLAVTLLPPALALSGWLTNFPHALYASFMGPAAAITALVSTTFAWSYHRRFLLERSLEEASKTDPLTGAANRRHFQEVLQKEVARSCRLDRPCALLMLDIDHFKRINDTHGHPTGDLVICALAEACTQNSRQGDSVARLGGEEFAILMPGTGATEAALLGERLRDQIEKLATYSDTGVAVSWTVSVGVVSVRPSLNENILDVCERLVKIADTALYDAKRGGRNCVVTFNEKNSVQ